MKWVDVLQQNIVYYACFCNAEQFLEDCFIWPSREHIQQFYVCGHNFGFCI